MPRLILGSGSPRRRELLAAAGYQFRVVEPDPRVECGACSGTGPAQLVAELAVRKANDVVRRLDRSQDAVVLAAGRLGATAVGARSRRSRRW